MLFKDRKFNIAIVISTSWHLLFMLMITPVLVPGKVRENKTAIYFLGSILQRIGAFREMTFPLEDSPFVSDIERIRGINLREFNLMQPEHAPKVSDFKFDRKESIILNDERGIRHAAITGAKRPRQVFRFAGVFLGGEARNRTILYKPHLPTVFILYPYLRTDCSVIVRFAISRHGFVKRPECSISSGIPEVDEAAIRYLRRWQFAPHYEEREDEQEGIVSLKINTL